MAGLAQLAKAAGHAVSGCDANVYPPMSEVLRNAGIELIEGYDPAQLSIKPDVVVIGNALSRGNPLVEAVLEAGLPYTSGAQWLAENVLEGKHVLAVAGTHGKTTTAAMLAHVMTRAGFAPGYLIGGVPQDLPSTAAMGGRHVFCH